MKLQKTNYAEEIKQENTNANPFDWYNEHIKWDYLLGQIKKLTPITDQHYTTTNGDRFEFSLENDRFICLEENELNIKPGAALTKFGLLCHAQFNNNWVGASAYVAYSLMKQAHPFVRVGTDYYKETEGLDAKGNEETRLKPWKKEALADDYGKAFIKRIPRFDDFINYPDNMNYSRVVKGRYNTYNPIKWNPEKGECPWSLYMMEHVFGDQLAQGLIYLKVLYTMPRQILPILVLMSRDRSTGKTTFLNWLHYIFGSNYTAITPRELESQFNASYANKLIIGIEETFIDKAQGVETIKNLGTTNTIAVNEKYTGAYNTNFYGKLILTTNKVYDFMRVDMEEIRFWLRELGNVKKLNTNIEEDLKKEIPAFLHYLIHEVPDVDLSRSRMVLTPEEIHNEQLETVKKESFSGLRKDLNALITEWFEANEDEIELLATAKHIKEVWFNYNSRITHSYIIKVLKNEYELNPEKMQRFIPFNGKCEDKLTQNSVSGKPYRFVRSDFTDSTFTDENEKLPF